jgi:hypothetical protein
MAFTAKEVEKHSENHELTGMHRIFRMINKTKIGSYSRRRKERNEIQIPKRM